MKASLLPVQEQNQVRGLLDSQTLPDSVFSEILNLGGSIPGYRYRLRRNSIGISHNHSDNSYPMKHHRSVDLSTILILEVKSLELCTNHV